MGHFSCTCQTFCLPLNYRGYRECRLVCNITSSVLKLHYLFQVDGHLNIALVARFQDSCEGLRLAFSLHFRGSPAKKDLQCGHAIPFRSASTNPPGRCTRTHHVNDSGACTERVRHLEPDIERRIGRYQKVAQSCILNVCGSLGKLRGVGFPPRALRAPKATRDDDYVTSVIRNNLLPGIEPVEVSFGGRLNHHRTLDRSNDRDGACYVCAFRER